MTMLVLHQWHLSNDIVKIQNSREIYKTDVYKLQNAWENGGNFEFKFHWVMIILTSLKV